MGSYGHNTFDDDFYTQRRAFHNEDERDNSKRETTHGNYLEKMLERLVTTAGVQGDRDIHAAAWRHHGKAVDHYGPKAVAGREDALHPELLNRTTGRQEPRVLAHMNDRLACLQELTVGLVSREKNEIELIKILEERGLLRPPEDGDEVG